MFKGIIGNNHVKKYLDNAVNSKVIGNSWLFCGPEGIGKSLFAIEFAKMLFSMNENESSFLKKVESGNHPDIKHYRPKGKVGMHTIDSLRHFIEEVYYRPFEAKWKIFIIHEAHRMQDDAANALLKTFEEPPSDSIIILLSHCKELLLPTILSRCQTMHFHPVPEEEIYFYLMDKHRCPSDEAKQYASLSQGSIGKALSLFHKGGSPLREKILNFISQEKLSTYPELSEFIKEIGSILELSKKEKEEEIKESLLAGNELESLTAMQKHDLIKDVEGATSLYFLDEANSLFNVILTWFRDLHLLINSGNETLLIHKDYSHLMQRKISSIFPSLEDIQKIINEAKISLQRSTPLTSCLENLFLKLNLIK